MSIDYFVDNFVCAENEIYSYSKKENMGFRRRLHSSISEFIDKREKNLRNQIYYLKRKNHKLENEYDILSNITVTSFNKTIENELANNEDEYVNIDINTPNPGYRHIVAAFIRMLITIYIAYFLVNLFDTSKVFAKETSYQMVEWK
jgi:hypothetical protein